MHRYCLSPSHFLSYTESSVCWVWQAILNIWWVEKYFVLIENKNKYFFTFCCDQNRRSIILPTFFDTGLSAALSEKITVLLLISILRQCTDVRNIQNSPPNPAKL